MIHEGNPHFTSLSIELALGDAWTPVELTFLEVDGFAALRSTTNYIGAIA